MKKILALILAVTMCFGVTACQKPETKTTDKPATEASKPVAATPTTEVKALTGKVVVYMPSPSGLNEKYVADFQKKTGVEVELFEGTTGEILARLEAEKDNPIADVVVLASWADGLSMKSSGQLQSYVPENADKVYKGWIDDDSMIFGTSASSVGVIYNTTLIKDLSADWSELSEEKYKDMVVMPDPEKSGSCKDFLSGYIYSQGDKGWSAWENLANSGMAVPGANKAALEAVTTGEKAILVAGVDYNAYSSIKKGEPLAIYYPKSGTVINPRPAMILKTSANLDNAKAFLDYLLSDDAQKLVAGAFLLPGKSDIKCENRTNVSDIPTFDLDWNWMMENSGDIATKLNSLCK